MASPRGSTRNIIEKVYQDPDGVVTKKLCFFGKGKIQVWLNKKPETPDEVYQLALDISVSSWGDKHLLSDSNQADQLVLELMQLAAKLNHPKAIEWLEQNETDHVLFAVNALIGPKASPPSDVRMVSPSAGSAAGSESAESKDIDFDSLRAQSASPFARPSQ